MRVWLWTAGAGTGPVCDPILLGSHDECRVECGAEDRAVEESGPDEAGERRAAASATRPELEVAVMRPTA